MLGYILGSDIDSYNLNKERIRQVKTEAGSINVILDRKEGEDIVFLPRHGLVERKIPSEVNYIGNMLAMKNLGVDRIAASFTTGALDETLQLGKIYSIVDFIDFTGRKNYISGNIKTAHVDMHEPFCVYFRNSIEEELDVNGWVVYSCAEGPRFETRAEINMMRNYSDVVGMTLCPEVILAKELGICYYGYTMPVNYATGINEGKSWDINGIMNDAKELLNDSMNRIITGYKKTKGYDCPTCKQERMI